jgi:hypothetical protein
MLTKKKTLLEFHSVQKTEDHVYFEYDAYADVPEVTQDGPNYRVGYYLPISDWVEMGSPSEVTVTVEVGDTMNHSLKDEGHREGPEEWDIDLNMPAREGYLARKKAETTKENNA